MQELDLYIKHLSQQRLSPYIRSNANSIAVYKWNIALSESFYPLLHIIEVSLRNRLHQAIAEVVNDNSWLLNRNPKIFKLVDNYWNIKIDITINEMIKKKKSDEGHLISEMPFGFWNMLLGRRFENKQFLWPKLKIKVFPFAHRVKINEIRSQFSDIKRLRNRIFHYESIWHWKDLQEQHNDILRAIHWIDPMLLKFVEENRFINIYLGGPLSIIRTVDTIEIEVVEENFA